jgi:hypothetical protein
LPVTGALIFLKMGSERPADFVETRQYDPSEIKTAKEHVETAKRESEHALRAAKKNLRIPFKMALTEDDLNAYLLDPNTEAGKKIAKERLEDLRIILGDGDVAIQCGAPFADRHLWIRANGPLRYDAEGRIFFTPKKVEFGRLKWALPSSAKEAVMKKVQNKTRGAILRIPGDIKTLKVTPGKLVIEGISDPKKVEDFERSMSESNSESTSETESGRSSE